MAAIYLQHPIHGTKVATMELEAQYDEKSGWVRYTPGTLSDPVVEVAPVNTLEVKRGRPRKATE